MSSILTFRKVRLIVLTTVFFSVSCWATVLAHRQYVSPDVPYLETPPDVVQAMLDLAKVTETDRVCDLGSGDGRIPLAAGRRGARSFGVELDPALVRQSRKSARDQGLSDRVEFIESCVFESNLRGSDVVFMYLSPRLNRELKPKLLKELRPGSRVVTHIFEIEGWAPEDTVVVSGRTLYLYKI